VCSMNPTAVSPQEAPARRRSSTLPDRPAQSLSPSRASDFMTCPLLYRLRTVDQVPEPPGPEAARGTLVHAVLERLFDLQAPHRSIEAALDLLGPAWADIVADRPELPGLLFGGDQAWERWLADEEPVAADPQAEAGFLTNCEQFLAKYFAIEDPTRIQPAERELSVSTELPSGLVLRGIVDRIDRAGNGAVRVVDYKTGRAPGEGWEAKALFQMRFYGVILWRLTGRIPARLQLLYIGSQERLTVDPTEQELVATQNKVQAIWDAIVRAGESDNWPARTSRLCDWCSFKQQCPEWT
jgi:putative RecB family exonuclease